MKLHPQRGSRLLNEAYETAKGLHKTGVIDDAKLREFAQLCTDERPTFSSDKIKNLRRRNKLDQAELASILDADVNTVKQWELGARKPSRPYQKLLQVLDRKGIGALQF